MTCATPEFDPPEWLLLTVEEALGGDGPTVWVPTGEFASSALARVPRFPTAEPSAAPASLDVDAPRNGTRSAQIAVASEEPLSALRCSAGEFVGPDGTTLPADAVQVRFVGYVPVEESRGGIEHGTTVDAVAADDLSGDRRPDLVADPLIDAETVDVPPCRAQPIWLTFRVPDDAPPGSYRGALTLSADGWEGATFDVDLDVVGATVPDREDRSFHLDVWFHADAVADEHGVESWSAAHWTLLERYFADLAAAGQRVVPTPVVHHPWEVPWRGGERRPQTAAGYESLVDWHERDGEWRFEFDRFDRFVETAFESGVGPSISAYSMLTFRPPQRLSYRDSSGEFVVERVEVGSDRWTEAWTAFLRSFSAHLDDRGWLERTYLGFDERPPEQLEPALALVDEVAPEFADRVQIAGSADTESYADDLSVLHRHLPLDDDVLERRRRAGRTTTFYVCVHPAHPNTFAFSPAVEARVIPWIAASERLDGFLRWAYNSWPAEPRSNPVFQFPQGDEYLVYPGDGGPASSVRWELLREGIEEYELVAALRDRDPGPSAADALGEALDLAAGEIDGREIDVSDLVRARRRVLDALSAAANGD